jgi:hypothetical protein
MAPVVVCLIAFVFVFGGALLGMFFRTKLSEHHLSAESRTVVTLGMGLVGTMVALVLGLLISSAKGFYDTQNAELIQLSANVILLDRLLAHYGPEAKEARSDLRERVGQVLEESWSKDRAKALPMANPTKSESFYDRIQDLTPNDERQRALKSQAASIAVSLGSTRWLMFEQSAASIPIALLVILIFWLTIIFASFGLHARTNGTVVASLLVSALSVSCAILLILEMYNPYHGLIQVSSAPLRIAFERLGQ